MSQVAVLLRRGPCDGQQITIGPGGGPVAINHSASADELTHIYIRSRTHDEQDGRVVYDYEGAVSKHAFDNSISVGQTIVHQIDTFLSHDMVKLPALRGTGRTFVEGRIDGMQSIRVCIEGSPFRPSRSGGTP